MTGWFFWTRRERQHGAGARTRASPSCRRCCRCPDGEGGWRDAGPPVGFPAGKTKTMVIDVGEILVRDDPRLRVSSTLRLYWDSIRLAIDADDADAAA